MQNQQIRHAVLTCTYTNELDSTGTLCKQSPSGAHRDPLVRVGRGVLAVAIGILLCIMPDAGSKELITKRLSISFREYALQSLNHNQVEYKCLNYLYGKESAWNPDAANGSHYGIPQGRSEYLARVDGYKQVDWGLSYIEHRYGTPCLALDHFRKKNWH